jgi:hypothetical protein
MKKIHFFIKGTFGVVCFDAILFISAGRLN